MSYRKHMYGVRSLCLLVAAIAFSFFCEGISESAWTLYYCVVSAIVVWNVYLLVFYVKVDEHGITVSCPNDLFSLFQKEFFPWDSFDEHTFVFDTTSCCLPKTVKDAFREPSSYSRYGVRRVFPYCYFWTGQEIEVGGDLVLYNNVCTTNSGIWVNGVPVGKSKDGRDRSGDKFYKRAFFDSDNNLMNDIDGRYVKNGVIYSADGKRMRYARSRNNVVILSDGKIDESAQMYRKAYYDDSTGICYETDIYQYDGNMCYRRRKVDLSHVICDPLPFSKAVNSCSGRSLIDLDKVAEMSRLGRQCIFVWCVKEILLVLIAYLVILVICWL